MTTIRKNANSCMAPATNIHSRRQNMWFFPLVLFLRRSQRLTNSSSTSTALLRLGTRRASSNTASMRSYTAPQCSFLGLRPAQPPAALAAFQSPASPTRTPPSTVTPPMAPVTTTALVRCPSAIPESKMPLTPTSTTTFAKMSLL